MSKEARNLLIKSLVFLFVLFFVVGLIGYIIHKLDWPSTLLLIGAFAFGSSLLTWLTWHDDRRTRERTQRIAERLEPFAMEVRRISGDFYTVASNGPFDNFIVAEELDLDQLEAWVQGLQTGIGLEEARQYDETMEARQDLQEQQHSEERAHRGTYTGDSV